MSSKRLLGISQKQGKAEGGRNPAFFCLSPPVAASQRDAAFDSRCPIASSQPPIGPPDLPSCVQAAFLGSFPLIEFLRGSPASATLCSEDASCGVWVCGVPPAEGSFTLNLLTLWLWSDEIVTWREGELPTLHLGPPPLSGPLALGSSWASRRFHQVPGSPKDEAAAK